MNKSNHDWSTQPKTTIIRAPLSAMLFLPHGSARHPCLIFTARSHTHNHLSSFQNQPKRRFENKLSQILWLFVRQETMTLLASFGQVLSPVNPSHWQPTAQRCYLWTRSTPNVNLSCIASQSSVQVYASPSKCDEQIIFHICVVWHCFSYWSLS